MATRTKTLSSASKKRTTEQLDPKGANRESRAIAMASGAPASLGPAERAVLEQALERGAAVRASADSAWAEFGQWLFAHVFGDDTSSAIDHRDDNPIWAALYALADGAKLRVRHDELERAVLTAAYDKRLNSDAWRALDFGRKWRLLKLADDKLLRRAAQHVLSTNLDTRGIDAYVRAVLEEQSEPVAVRVNVSALVGALDRMQEKLTDRGFAKQLASASKKLSDDKREALVSSINATRDALDAILRRLDVE
jgi:hypothetical protein